MQFAPSRFAWRRAGIFMAVALFFAAPLVTAARADAAVRRRAVAHVEIGAAVTRQVDLGDVFGEGIDGGDPGTTASALRPDTVAAVRSLGLRRLSYRLRTELGVEAWHWNPEGTWSDAREAQGYWTSSEQAVGPVERSSGYRLPRRGSTTDQAANDGYSRLDDGDTTTFWKSNPYLDARWTGEPEPAHAQWVVIDLGTPTPIDAVRLAWGTPWATTLDVQRWIGDDPVADPSSGRWSTFANGHVAGDAGGDEVIHVAPTPIPVRWLRILLLESSHTMPVGSRDPRDAAGFALRELGAGTLRSDGTLSDVLRHGLDAHHQSWIAVSSTDPWHRATDRDPLLDQPGIDAVTTSGLAGDAGFMLAVPLLYGTPEDAVALLRHVTQQGIRLRALELGEEPDGQLATPEDVGALHEQWARALHAADPTVPLVGPSLQSDLGGWRTWPDDSGTTSWVARFATRATRSLGPSALSAVSFEWYPFDDVCTSPRVQLSSGPALLEEAVRSLRSDLPPGVGLIISELGWSSFAGRPEVELPGALMIADAAVRFLELGGDVAFAYGTFPDEPLQESTTCRSWGNLMGFMRRSNGSPGALLPVAHMARLLTGTWAGVGTADLLATSVTGGRDLTEAAVRRSDGTIALVLLNLDLRRRARVEVATAGHAAHVTSLTCYGPAQYRWADHGPRGHPTLDRPPAPVRVDHRRPGHIDVPAGSACVATTTPPRL